MVLVLILHCRSSFRGVTKAFADLLGKSISIGTIFNIVQDATEKAENTNEKQDISNIVHGSLDEVFQKNKPVLTGVDIRSLYCFLLSEQDHRDAETWAFLLLYLKDQGFSPDYTLADFAQGLREGQSLALPDIPCHGDIFHLIQQSCQMPKKRRKNIENCPTISIFW